MPAFKVNHLVNLADARYCAAVGVKAISFSVEKGNMAKLPPELISEICGWLSGVDIVLDVGKDVEAFEYYFKQPEHQSFHISADWSLWENNFPNNGWITIEIPNEDVLLDATQWMRKLPSPSIPVEIYPTADAHLSAESLSYCIQQSDSLWLNIDNLTLEFLSQLTTKPVGFSARKAVQVNLLQLDYDRFEDLQAHLNTHFLNI